MINSGLKVLSFDGTQTYNTTTTTYNNVGVQVTYPVGQTVVNNPITTSDLLIESNANIWSVVSAQLTDSGTKTFKLSLLLVSETPSADISPSYGVGYGAVVTLVNNIVAPFWDAALVNPSIARIASIYNTNKVGIPGLDSAGKIKVTQLPSNLTVDKLTTARNIVITGDVTGNTSFDGSANVTITGTLANTAVTPGNYKSVTVDNKGRVTAGTNPTTIVGFGLTDAVNTSIIGAANGLATLDGTGKITAGQLPTITNTTTLVVDVTNWASGTWTAPSGVTIAKDYSDSSIRITHNLAKSPISWIVYNKDSSPSVAMVVTNSNNLQADDAGNYVIITNVANFNKFTVRLTF